MKTAVLCALLLLALTPAPGAEMRSPPPETRGQFAVLLWESAGAVPFDANTPFHDVDRNDDCATAVGWGITHGLFRGTGDDNFSPQRPITREEVALLLRRNAALLNRSTFVPDSLSDCNDGGDMSQWADDSLYWATDVGLLSWSPGGRLDPHGTLSPTEARQLVMRFQQGAYDA